MTRVDKRKATAVGINHLALEVGDIEAALEFYGRFLEFEVTHKSDTAAFIYFGDQFINFALGREQGPDQQRHFGIAVDGSCFSFVRSSHVVDFSFSTAAS